MSVDFSLEPVNKPIRSKGRPRKSVVKERQTKSVEEKPRNGECADFSSQKARLKELEDRLWTAADELRANSRLRSTDYSPPVLGLLFLRYADYRFGLVEAELADQQGSRRRPIGKEDYQARGVLYLAPEARYQYLLTMPESANIGQAIDNAMRTIERDNEELRDVLSKVYEGMERSVLVTLLRIFNFNLNGFEGDIFGKIYEYFLGKFAMAEGQRAGEFFTPTSIVKLIVNVIEPYHGRILDPACGSGGMFVQSAEFVKEHQKNTTDIMVYGQERVDETVRLCKMNLAVHGLSGDIKQGNTYYEDVHNGLGKFDFVMANPPFNVNNVDKEAIKADPRYPFGLPKVDNANYLWIQAFYSMLNETGRAGFVMANSASDARYSELEIRKKILEDGVVDVVISIASNFFYTVTGAATLWFFDKRKRKTDYRNMVLLIDARNIFTQVDRAHKEFTDQQIEFISNIVRLFRGQEIEIQKCSSEMMDKYFPEKKYNDITGICKIVTVNKLKEYGWSLDPGIYVGKNIEYNNDLKLNDKIPNIFEQLKILTLKSYQKENEILDIIKKIFGDILNDE